MAYSTTLGRWLEADPAGYVDEDNLYQFVDDDPISLLDPTGLDATDGKFSGAFQPGATTIGGNAAIVAVYLYDKSMKPYKGGGDAAYIGLIAASKPGGAGKAQCDQCEWLQFVYRTVDSGKQETFRNKNLDEYPSSTDENPIRRTDNNKKGSPFASKDYKGTKRSPDKGSLTFVDSPDVPIAGKAVYDSYLVCGGKVTYHIHWERSLDANGNLAFGNISGDPASNLPDWAPKVLKHDGLDNPVKP